MKYKLLIAGLLFFVPFIGFAASNNYPNGAIVTGSGGNGTKASSTATIIGNTLKIYNLGQTNFSSLDSRQLTLDHINGDGNGMIIDADSLSGTFSFMGPTVDYIGFIFMPSGLSFRNTQSPSAGADVLISGRPGSTFGGTPNLGGGALNFLSGDAIGDASSTISWGVAGGGSSGTGVSTSTPRMWLTNTGLGVATNTPAVKLDVYGQIRATNPTKPSCTATIRGSIQYDVSDDHFYGCRVGGWAQLDN